MKYEKSCGAIIYKKENDEYYLLMVMHVNGGHWSFPKGHVEDNETEEQTAVREIKEETHLDVKVDTSFRHVVTYSPCSGVTKDVVYFVATPKTTDFKPQAEEISKIAWIKLSDAYDIVTFDNDRGLIVKVLGYIKNKR